MDLLQEVDVFVLPNRQTYYDLILLEVMRAGKPVLLTTTGGNKHFLGYKDTGLFFVIIVTQKLLANSWNNYQK